MSYLLLIVVISKIIYKNKIKIGTYTTKQTKNTYSLVEEERRQHVIFCLLVI